MKMFKSSQTKRIAAAAAATLLAGAVVVTSVFNRTQAAENADTLMGIEKLRNRMAEGGEYTILEIVPDINAAEIGYLFDGYEPILSQWDSKTMSWKSWKDILCGLDTTEARREFVIKKTEALRKYYADQKLLNEVPVTLPDLGSIDIREEYEAGYEEVEGGGYDDTGYFVPVRSNDGDYFVAFDYAYANNISRAGDVVYYEVDYERPIYAAEDKSWIADGAYIYKYNGSIFESVGTWGSIKDTAFPSTGGGGDDDDSGNGSVDGSDESEDRETDGDSEGTGDGDNSEETYDGDSEDGNNSEETAGESEDVTGDDENDSESSDNTVEASAAVGNTFSQFSWIKFVNLSNLNTSSEPDSDDNTVVDPGQGGGQSGDGSQGGDQGNQGGDNQGNQGGDGNQNGDGNQGGEGENQGGDGNQGGEGGDNPGGEGGDNPGGESGDNPGGESGDNPGGESGDNPGGEGGDNPGGEGNQGDDDNKGGNTGKEDPDENPDDENPDENPDEEDPDENPDEEDPDDEKDSDKKPDHGAGDTPSWDVSRDETYYVVYFKRADITIGVNSAYYTVREGSIKPATIDSATGNYMGQQNFQQDNGDYTQTYHFPGRVLYCDPKGIFHSNEWFKQYVINMNKENFGKFNVKVITLTPDDLNKIYTEGTEEYAQGTIPDFDFLYLNSGLRVSEIDAVESQPDSGNGGGGSTGGGESGTGGGSEEETPGDEGGTGSGSEEETPGGESGTGSEEETPGGEGGTGNEEETPGDGGETGNEEEVPGDEGGTGNENEVPGDDVPLAATYMSAWRTYVSNDAEPDPNNTEEPKTADDNGTVAEPDNTDNDSTTDDNGTIGDNEGDENNAENPDNQDTENPDDSNNNDEPDNSGETDIPDGRVPLPDSEHPVGGRVSIAVYNTGNNDLNTSVVDLLYTKIAANALPALVDGSILYEKSAGGATESHPDANTENTDVFRLAAMLCQQDLSKDYTGVSKTDLLKGIEDGDKNFTTEQVYCRLGDGKDSIINSLFFNPTMHREGNDEVEEGFRNVLDEIELENLYRKSDTSAQYRPLSTNVSQAEAVRHIINYQNRRNVETKKNIKVLEIQPALTTKPELDLKQIKKWAPGVENVETTIMTTAEFIGKIDKINEIYDLVYIGTSKEHLNISNWLTDTGKSSDGKYLGSTVYNDSDMDGLIYSNIGDKRVVYLPMSGLLDSEYRQSDGRTYYYNFVRYGGNDITKEKKDALLSFLDGSYPIIISDDFIEQPLTVFEDDSFAGRRVALGVGTYHEEDLRVNQIFTGDNTPAKGISSFQLKDGYQVTLYSSPDCTGKTYGLDYITYTGDVDVFAGVTRENLPTWNNRCRSLVVERIQDTGEISNADINKALVRNIDGNHIDNSSYLYEFVQTALNKDYKNFFAYSDLDENGSQLFKFYLNRAKASLVNFKTNGFKSSELGSGTGANTNINDVTYIYPNVVGRYTLQYEFTIQNEGAASMDTRYYCKLYIDVNADGKFSEYEEVTDIVMLNKNTGSIVSSNELYAGIPYTITREVPTGYKGLLPWKVEVCQINNANIYASQQGYTKLNGLDKEILKICQINKNGNDVIDLNWEVETEGTYFHILIYGGTYEGVTYPGILNDFELDVTTISINEYEANFAENNDYLDGFNMLILGFSDMYGDFTGDSNTGAMGAIVEFINSGKSVLLAHDTTSFFNNPIVDGTEMGWTQRNSTNASADLLGYNGDARFAATLNKYVRPLVGMDRYGVLSSGIVKRGVALKDGQGGWGDLVNSRKDVAYKPKSGRTESVPEAQGYSYTVISAKDKRGWDNNVTDLNYNKSNLYTNNTPGYGEMTDPVFRNEYVNQRFDDSYYWDNTKDNGEMNVVNNGEVNRVHVTQVNQGQITEYPYKLKDDFEVGMTHSQYYQLDYTADDDQDGQSDLVVWYCLGGRTASEDKSQTIYSQSPNDVRNNYYIYNKGNITYTGMGHSAQYAQKYTFEEAKLFINTMIASYQAGVKPPSITILESGLPESAQLTTMYRYYDEVNNILLTDATNTDTYEKVYFTVRDLNFVKGSRMIESHAYYHIDGEGGSETINVDGEEIAVTPLAELIHRVDTDEFIGPYPLNSGDIYYILVPKDVMKRCEDGLDIYLEARSTITTNTTIENVYTTDKVYAKLRVLRAYLFELD